MNENEKPAIGSSEAAVLTVVELIARAAQMSEQHLAYWLDLYYQVRSRHEKDMTPNFDDLLIKVESPDPVMERLDEIGRKLDELHGQLVTGKTVKFELFPVTPITEEDVKQAEAVSEAVDDAIEKAAAGSKKQRLTGADLRKVRKKAGSDSGAGYQWRAYKRSVLERLSEARARGVTSAEISAASEGKLTDNAVMDFLEAVFRPIDDYRALETALDRLAEEK